MTLRTLITRSLRFHWRAHVGVVLGAAVGSAALIGALIVGDSVRGSLRERALERLGWVEAALDGGDRFFPHKLAERIVPINRAAPEAMNSWNFDPVLKLPGTASRQDGTARANQVNVLGVGYWSFWQSSRITNAKPSFAAIPNGSVVLNEALAAQLHAKVGDEVILRLHKPTALSRDVPITPQSENTVALRLKVFGIATAPFMGNFDLRSSQTPPLNAFLLINTLAPAVGLDGKANLILAGDFRTHRSAESKWKQWWHRLEPYLPGYKPMMRAMATTTVPLTDWRMEWRPRIGDLSYELRSLTNQSMIELRSDRIFLEPAVAAAVFAPRTNRSSERVPFWAASWMTPWPHLTNFAGNELVTSLGRPALTYLVNQLRAGTNTTPYSMVTAAGAPWTPADLRDDEIVVNDWLAEDLQLTPGDTLDLTYFLAESGAQLVERTNRFRVRSIVPLSGLHADQTLMPEFPGLAKAESTHEWDAGFPLTHKIRKKDDDYWKQHRGTPKAFVTLRAGQAMWGNRFGNLTAIRFPVPAGEEAAAFQAKVEGTLSANLDPESLGLRFERVREQALRAAEQSQDFGGLFIGFSFFVIGAALILMGLLFRFGIEQRAAEIGTLLALGFTPRRVRNLFLLEGAALAFLGSMIGAVGGIFYARAMLHGLTTIWRSATNTSALTFHASPVTLVVGVVSGTLVAVVTIWLVLRKQARQPARALLAGDWSAELRFGTRTEATSRPTLSSALRRCIRASVIAWAALAFAVITVAIACATGESANPEFFFSAGSLALIAGLAGTSAWLAAGNRQSPMADSRSSQISPARLLRNAAARRKNRSVATVALLAGGVFLIASIGVFRLDADANAWKRSSGTGGFALIGESTLPIVKDLNTKEGRDALGLDERAMQGVSFVSFRVREGDDASCLNLNRAQQPRLLGGRLASMPHDAFSFSSVLPGAETKTSQWTILSRTGVPDRIALDQNEAAAIGDAASIQWALHKKIGDTLPFRDERGNDFEVRLVGGLANSILQGSLVIDEAEFTRRFPGISGHRMFLIDCPSNALPQVSAELSRALQDFGFQVTPAAERLAAFNAVQNTYLNTFQILGGLGLLLGSAGLGIVVLRNVLERRSELALFIAVGFRRGRVQSLVLAEHVVLLGLGLVIGVASALVAVLPALLSPRGDVPVQSLALTLGGVLMFGLISTWLATRVAVRGNLLEGLRNE
jgi:ABC-type lipoprotein release transport system permease subunit